MLKRRFDGKMIGALFITLMTMSLSAFAAATRSADAWTLDPSDFRYDMAIYFSISAPGYDNLDEYEVAAFIDNECRGLAEKIDLPEGQTGMYMRIYSNSTDPQEVDFIMRNRQTGKIFHLQEKAEEPVIFKSNEMIGMPSDPYVMYIYFDIKANAGDNGSVDFSDGLYAAGSEIKIVAVPDEGYHFDGWSDGNKDAERTITVTADLDITASFAPNSYTVEFKIGDEYTATKTFLFGENVVAPQAPEKEGYTFAGWENLPATMPAKDLVITGSYVVKTYKVVFMDGDKEVSAEELTFGAAITAPAAPEKEGYTFTGWSTFPSNMPAEDLVVTANYTVNSYKLSFSIGNEVIESKEITYGSPIVAPEAPEKEGYTFSGWGDVPATMPAKDLAFTGSYTVANYTITFVIDDVVIEEKQLAYGDAIVAPATPDKDGHKFEGWFNLPETMPAENLTIYGTYSTNSHLLTFMIDDQIFEEKVVLYGAVITAPEVPAKEGYTFSGWGDVPATMPAKDLVISGSYKVNTYKLTFTVDNEIVEMVDKEYGAEISLPAMPEKEGYTFSGWGDVPATMPAEDLAFNATYTLNSYKLSFVIDGETVESKEMPYGAAITAPEVEERVGYTFSGWTNLPSTMPANDLQVTGAYAVNTYKITFVIDDVVIEEKELAFGTDIVAPSVPDKDGHKFGGWLNLVPTMPAADLTVLGTYEKNAYLLTFMIDDEVIDQKVMALDSEISAPEAPVKEGYTFSGWETIPSTMPAHDLTIKGSYSVNSYKLTFVIGDEIIAAEQVVYGSDITAPQAPEKEGYTFSGWDNLPASMPAADLSVTGSYKANTYKLTFVIDDVVVEEKELTFGADIVAPATPDKDGHKFVGWINLVETMPAADLTIIGTYEKNSHLLTFVVDGVTIEEKVVPFGSDIVAPVVPEKEGYTFSGWSEIPASMPGADLVITGSYDINTYKITFSIDGEVISTDRLIYGSDITAPEAPAKEGYTFAGWSELPASMPAGELNVTGSYAINTYKLTFVIDDVTVEEKELAFGAEIVAPATPDKDGHKFVGWLNLAETMPAADLTILGTYEKNTHLISFVIDGVVVEEKVVLFGSEIVAPEAPVKEGYTFAGWTDLPATMPAADVVINGVYALNSYKITFLLNADVIETATLPYGAEIVTPAAPVLEGYSFIGWGEVPATMPASDVTFTALYTTLIYRLSFVIDNVVVEEKEMVYGAEIVAPATPDKDGHKFVGWLNLVETMPAADLTIIGTYEKNAHLLSFVIDGVPVEEKVVVYGSEITAPEAPAKEGYTFLGWSELPATMPAKDLVITGSYDINSYVVTFVNGEETVEAVRVVYGQEITAPEAPAKEGYTFIGWSELPATMPASDITVNAAYALNSYKLTVIIDEEVVEEMELPYGAEIVAPATPDKDGHKFEGWFNIVETMPAADLTIYGTYVKNAHLLSFVIDGEIVEEKVVLFGSEIVAPEAPDKPGYTFAGWEEMPATMPAKDLVINGAYNINSYKLTFTVDDEVIETLNLEYGAEIVAPVAPEKVGHTFTGWEGLTAIMPAADLSVYAAYTLNSYRLTVIIDDTVIEETVLPYGAEIVAPATPDKDGHKFEGWFNLVETMPAADLTIYGTYVKNAHLLSFVIDGEIVEEKVVLFGSEIVAPEAPAKPGYTFAGWEEMPATMPAKDLVINGSYSINSYKLTFAVADEVIETLTLEYGAEITAPAAPDKEGYTFAGWADVPATMPASDLTVTGSYALNSYLLTLYINDEIFFQQTFSYGAEISVPEVELPDNMKFEGWEEEIPATMPADDITIYGKAIEDTPSSVEMIFGADTDVTIYNLNGVMLYKNVKSNELRDRLVPGIYIINGKKIVIR